VLLPALADIGPADAGGEFRPQGQRIPAPVLERVHLLGDDVGGLAERSGEHFGRLEHRHLDMLEGVEPAHAVERLDHPVKAVGRLTHDVLGAPDLLRTLAHGRGLSSFARRGNRSRAAGWTSGAPTSYG
jgi:hypothetical protein